MPSHTGKSNVAVEVSINLQTINPPQHSIPKIGNQGENGTLNGLGLFGSVCLKINTATHTTINDVNVP